MFLPIFRQSSPGFKLQECLEVQPGIATVMVAARAEAGGDTCMKTVLEAQAS